MEHLFPGDSAGKESACNAGYLGLIPGLGTSPGEGNDYSVQYSGLENSMDSIVHEFANSWTWLSNFHFHFNLTKQLQIFILFQHQKLKDKSLHNWKIWHVPWIFLHHPQPFTAPISQPQLSKDRRWTSWNSLDML